jgi:hypothetical protein
MSNNSLDSVETTLRDLRDIVDRNHPETSVLMQDMEKLIAEMKQKTVSSKPFVSMTFAEENPVTISAAVFV